MISMQDFYTVGTVDTVEEVFALMTQKGQTEPSADQLNWLFLSTSGVHGSLR